MRHIYDMKNKFWAGLGWFGQPGQYMKNKFMADYEQLLRAVFSIFCGQKFFLKKNIIASTLKNCIEKK